MPVSEPPANATTTVNRVVTLLGVIAITTVVGIVVLAALERTVPEGLIALASGSVGALGAMLASTRSVDVAGLNELAALRPHAAPAPRVPAEQLAAGLLPQAVENPGDETPGAPGA